MVVLEKSVIEAILRYVDENLTENMDIGRLAEKSGYSAFHFSRAFSETLGIPPMAYVTWRKLQFALRDVFKGDKIIDAAVKYGFESHGGFVKACRKRFGSPPSVYVLRAGINEPCAPEFEALRKIFGKEGKSVMNPHIIELTPFTVVGFPSRHRRPNMKNTADAPTFWNTIDLDYGPVLTKLYDAFPKSKHCEISMRYDVDESAGEFTYMLGRGVDNPGDLANIEPSMTRVEIAGGLYAIFPTPPAADSYIQAARDTWSEIFSDWLPGSEFEFDESRHDFEYHDHRDHGWYFDGKLQIDVCIPVRQKEEAKRKAQAREKSL